MPTKAAAKASGDENHRYVNITEEKASGSTYTPHDLARFVAAQIVDAMGPEFRDRKLSILDPAVGDGMLLDALAERLYEKGIFNFTLHGYDTNPDALEKADGLLKRRVDSQEIHLSEANFLELVLTRSEQSDLFRDTENKLFDLVIANPPYVRTQIMGADAAQRLARQFGLTGRVDLYYTFLLGLTGFLATGGITGIIVSNRFMTVKAGESVRSYLRANQRIDHVWDLGDTKLFEVAVLPAVLLLRNQPQGTHIPEFTSIYEADESDENEADSVIEALSMSGLVRVPDGRSFRVQHGRLHLSDALTDVWRIATDDSDKWLDTVDQHTWGTFKDVGKIRVGVKTTADKVFIRKDWRELDDSSRPEALKPLTTHHIARRFRATEDTPSQEILYTHEVVNGKRAAIDIEVLPKTKKYLDNNRESLEKRRYVIDAGRQWYEIWVPQDPGAWSKPKLVFRDIAVEPTFWIDYSGSVVNGDCYWMVSDNGGDDRLLWLALAVANSDFAVNFYDHKFHNKLYAGRRRFITQYVEKFPLPDPESEITNEIVSLAKKAYERAGETNVSDIERELDVLIRRAFGFTVEEV